MTVNVEQLFAELLNESTSAANTADLAKLVADLSSFGLDETAAL